MTNTEYLRQRLLTDVHDTVSGEWCIGNNTYKLISSKQQYNNL